MIIRAFKPSDAERMAEIHKQYEHEFHLLDFGDEHYLCAFVVVDDDDRIITGGGIRTIPEVVLVTDKNYHARTRYEALKNILLCSKFVARQANYHELHAFVQDENWKCQLEKFKFESTRGKSLVLNLG